VSTQTNSKSLQSAQRNPYSFQYDEYVYLTGGHLGGS
jgi:hypothetical protein